MARENNIPSGFRSAVLSTKSGTVSDLMPDIAVYHIRLFQDLNFQILRNN